MALAYDGDQPWADKAVDEFRTDAMDPDHLREQIVKAGLRVIEDVLAGTTTEVQVWSSDDQDSIDVDMTSYAESVYAEEITEAVQNATDELIETVQKGRFA